MTQEAKKLGEDLERVIDEHDEEFRPARDDIRAAARAELRALLDCAIVLRWENTGQPRGVQFVLAFSNDPDVKGPSDWTVQDSSAEHRVFSRGKFVNGLPVLNPAARAALEQP